MTGQDLTSTARALVAEGKGILAADESTGTIEKRFESIGAPSTEANRRGWRELLFTTTSVAEHISGVILFDEIEKAHPDLFNILLQVMDHGKLTDHNGKEVDFRNAILIMTTNAGATELARPAIGFGRETREGDDDEAIKRAFSPEFRNRLDAVIGFSSLPPEVIAQVVNKFIAQLEAQLADRAVSIELSEDASTWLASRGYDQAYGARPLARAIQEHIKKPLADELLFGRLTKGGHVKVSVEANKLSFEVINIEPSKKPRLGEDATESDETVQ